MQRSQRSWTALLSVFLFLFALYSLAHSDTGNIECLSEHSIQVYFEGEDLYPKDNYSVARKQVLLEIGTATW
jgi:hypothetical protein